MFFPRISQRMGPTLTGKPGCFFSLVVAALVFLSPGANAQSGQKWTIDSALGMMDAAARDFHTLTANVEHIKYTDVVKDTSKESGQMWLRKKDDKMRIEFSHPDPRTILRTGDNLAIYNPKINRIEEYTPGKNAPRSNHYLSSGSATLTRTRKKS